MNANEKHEVIARFARRGLVLVGLLVAALCFAGPSRAQSNAAPGRSPAVNSEEAATSQGQAAPAAPQSPSSAATARPAAPAEKNSASPAKGQHEGITVHGHWTIEVKNPDGTVASHREFENAIANSGGDLLTGLLSGEYAAGGFYINLAGGTGSLCTNYVNAPNNCFLIDKRFTTNSGACSAASAAAGQCGTLTYTPNAGTAPTVGAVGYTLTGSVQPAGGGTIASVATGAVICSAGTVPPHGTAFSQLSPQTCGTTNSTPSPQQTEDLTSTVPTPSVTVITGQSVSVTVVITFGSS